MKTKISIFETLAIGDELLTGKISDTNSTFVANELFSLGLRLDRQTVIADESSAIKSAVVEASKRAEIVICFGGLGPTSDDKTASSIAELLRVNLIEHSESKTRLIDFIERRKRSLTPQVLKQIIYPKSTTPLLNNSGLAVGFSMKLDETIFFFLPGVPEEMKTMFKEHVLPSFADLIPDSKKIFSHIWRCLELPESELQRLMEPIERALPKNSWLGYRTRYPENHLTLYHQAFEKKNDFELLRASISQILVPYVYGESSKEIEEEVFELLRTKKKTLGFVESCTGGIACHRMTRIPGASQFIKGGVISYTRDLKNSLMGLSLESDDETVSAKCTQALAINGKKVLQADIVAAVTGYMGPTGGTDTDPTGTLYIGVFASHYRQKRIFQPWRNRSEAQWGAATHLLNLVRIALKEEI